MKTWIHYCREIRAKRKKNLKNHTKPRKVVARHKRIAFLYHKVVDGENDNSKWRKSWGLRIFIEKNSCFVFEWNSLV